MCIDEIEWIDEIERIEEIEWIEEIGWIALPCLMRQHPQNAVMN